MIILSYPQKIGIDKQNKMTASSILSDLVIICYFLTQLVVRCSPLGDHNDGRIALPWCTDARHEGLVGPRWENATTWTLSRCSVHYDDSMLAERSQCATFVWPTTNTARRYYKKKSSCEFLQWLYLFVFNTSIRKYRMKGYEGILTIRPIGGQPYDLVFRNVHWTLSVTVVELWVFPKCENRTNDFEASSLNVLRISVHFQFFLICVQPVDI